MGLYGYSAGLVGYPNGAVVPYDPFNQAATAAHLATRGLYGGYGHIWKREAEADAGLYGYSAGLVGYSNGAVVPFDPANQAATAAHLATRGLYGGYGHIWKREAEADAGVYGYPHPAVAHYGLAPASTLVAHPNGAVVPAEPYAVVQARANHLATKYGLH